MTAILAKMKSTYDFLFYELADERSRYMFPDGWVLLTVLPFYLYFSLSLGPRLMRDQKPFKLTNIIFYYNLFQIYICAHALVLGLRGGWLTTYNYACQPYDPTDSPESRILLNAAWFYAQTKLIDLMDTVFFVLRKKDRQISFLHVIHHFMMPIASFMALKYYPNGHGTLVGIINSVVHIVMYTYYLISGLGPEYQKYLWWKKHLTSMQIVQFGMVFIHNLVALLDTSCTYPKWISWTLMISSLLFVYMFGNFYYVNYIQKVEKNQKSEKVQMSVKNSNGSDGHFENNISNEKRKVL